jgi:cell division protein FtsL
MKMSPSVIADLVLRIWRSDISMKSKLALYLLIFVTLSALYWSVVSTFSWLTEGVGEQP